MGQKTLTIRNNRTVGYAWPGDGEKCMRTGFKWRACPSLRHAVRYKNSCHRRDCPDHWRDWLDEESAAAADRVKAAGRQRWQHVVVSFKGGILGANQDDRKRDLARVRWVLEFCGFTGGAIVCHPARAHTKRDFEGSIHSGDGDAHFHGLCCGWCDSERVLALSAWYNVVVVAFGRDNLRAKARFTYMLSHAALPYSINPAPMEGTTALHSVTYWGILAYNKLKVPEYQAECYCPGCKMSFPRAQWHDLRCLDEPPDIGLVDLPFKNAYGRNVFEPVASWGDM